jgi:CRP-like cAMP-binding protein
MRRNEKDIHVVTIDQTVRRQELGELGLFRGLSRPVLERVAGVCTEVAVEPGQELCRAGEPVREFVIVLDGAASVTANGAETHRLGPGSCFGEIGLVDGYDHPTGITAVTRMRLLVVPGPEFLGLVHSDPELASRLLAMVAGRVRMLMSEVSEWADAAARSPSRRTPSAHSGSHRDALEGSTAPS